MLLVAEELTKVFRSGGLLRPRREVRALDGVSFELARGQSLGVVGESGSGKSTLLRTVLKLTPQDSGTLLFDGQEVAGLSPVETRRYRRRVQPVFQDPYSTFNPRFSIGSSIALAFQVNGIEPEAGLAAAVADLLRDVGLNPDLAQALPHQLSGGQRQRAAIARALAVRPELLLLDEPTSALDVSVQAQVLNLFKSLKQTYGFSMVLVTHDLALVSFICDHTIVMKAGAVVERGPTVQIIARPKAAYTRDLIAAVPQVPGLGAPQSQEDLPCT